MLVPVPEPATVSALVPAHATAAEPAPAIAPVPAPVSVMASIPVLVTVPVPAPAFCHPYLNFRPAVRPPVLEVLLSPDPVPTGLTPRLASAPAQSRGALVRVPELPDISSTSPVPASGDVNDGRESTAVGSVGTISPRLSIVPSTVAPTAPSVGSVNPSRTASQGPVLGGAPTSVLVTPEPPPAFRGMEDGMLESACRWSGGNPSRFFGACGCPRFDGTHRDEWLAGHCHGADLAFYPSTQGAVCGS